MRQRWIPIWFLATLAVAAQAPVAVVPFELFHNRVYLPVRVNGQSPIAMVLDTGAADFGLDTKVAPALGVVATSTADLVGNGEVNQKIGLARDVRFELGSAAIVEKMVALVPFAQLEAREGHAVPGVVGVDIFRRFVVEIDYLAKTVSLFAPGAFSYAGPGVVVPLRISSSAIFNATVACQGHPPLATRLAIDTGTYSGLLLHRPFAQDHALLHDAALQPRPDTGFGVGGDFPVERTERCELQIASLHIADPGAMLSEAATGASANNRVDGTIGGAILCRYRVTIDYPHSRMILENRAPATPPN
ncbi:MAG TPA: retropepsin-like aspartic protease [Terriglobales bacterium]|jgi:hypothetical protein